MADFLLELLSEEIPARMQAKARHDLARLFAQFATEAGLGIGAIDCFSTPRRLALIARDVADATQASREEIKGPRTSAPPQALEGFLKKTGLTHDQLEDRDGVYFALIERPGRSAAEILADAMARIVAEFPWPKSMRWGDGELRWVRPLHGIVALLGEDIVPIAVAGVASGATTLGHRFHHPGPITIGGASDYVEKLRACHVIVDQAEREALIREGASAAASAAGLTLLADEGLVVENAGLSEWPVPVAGSFDPEFLDVPREVIVLTMRTNQKYFACTNDQGLLAPAFVCVANIDANDGGEAIAKGNARVLAARLSDARFFWEQDVKVPLDEQAKKLSGIVFHEKLGTVADKVDRVAKLARWLVENDIVTPTSRHSRESGDPASGGGSGTPASAGVTKEELADQVERAARLAKADLVTGMVGEFPELQGVIGGYLAQAQGEPREVADAIRDHYDMPSEPTAIAVALADRLDSIFGFFLVGEKPTGSKDPFALRRAAIQSAAILIGADIRLKVEAAVEFWGETSHDDLERPFDAHFDRLAEQLGRTLNAEEHDDAWLKYFGEPFAPGQVERHRNAVLDFFADRLKVQQREAGVRHDLIDAVFSLGGEDDLVRLLARVKALQNFVETDEGRDLLTAYKRAANILKKEGWTGPQVMSSSAEDGIPQTGEEDPLALVEEPILREAIAEMASGAAGADLPEEQGLIAALDEAEPRASAAIEAEDFTGAMTALATLRGPIDAFFEHVKVNDPDAAKREGRLNLLGRFREAVDQVADFSKIEG